MPKTPRDQIYLIYYICNLKKKFDEEEKKFISIGLAYSEQEIKSIPYENHDERLDFIITEKEIISKID